MAYSPFNKKYFAEKQRLEAEARRKAEINEQMLKTQFDRLTARPSGTSLNPWAIYPFGTVGDAKFKTGDFVTPTKDCKSKKAKHGAKGIVQSKVSNYDTLGWKYVVLFPNGETTLAEGSLIKYEKYKPPKPKVTFDSVIMPDDKKELILDAIGQIDHHETIFEKWGFGEVFEKGTAISMLFYGVPGTGKTLMAQAIAEKYGKKLKIISTAEIESSEPGAAERNIKAFFENTKDDTVLLFDECDSLIYDRTNVGAILAAQVNQLLSCLEHYTGIVIFTTNRLGVLDEAFNRRLSLKLEFEMPKFEERVQIWKRMFPKKAPVDKKMDWERLAKVEIAGGYIKNAVLRAARMAAVRGHKKITTDIVVSALKDELRAVVEFDEAKKNDHTPRLVGGSGYGVRRTTDIRKEMTNGTS